MKVSAEKWKPPGSKVTQEMLISEEYPGVDTRAVLILAGCIQKKKTGDDLIVSWEAQEEAMKFHNDNGFQATLNECLRLDPNSLDVYE